MPSTPEVGFAGRAILNSDDCLIAEARIAKLAIAPDGSDEEAERVGLIDAVNAYRLKQDTPATAAMTNPISSLEQYEEATQRVEELANYAEGTPQADELGRLVADIRAWEEAKQDNASRRQ
ncbi:hypothetical protein B6S44_28960 [Bosea sp. Tri-44]|uniref:hypothetical protein n=1 Tax=Bosea sp. Tri-44 TaxID=1972137 RepID=UPI00100D9EDF|nr:hypothetical protein [Bosea sp. Tri-44]RXT43096.1 hypothetical protein B6S44_28960 [Bosea sp. Tri-44]